jgi:hypothetical protein
VAGLPTADPALEKRFVFGEHDEAKALEPAVVSSPVTERHEGKGPMGKAVSRVPLTTRVRADFATALKRASLQRQLDDVFPNSLQDILEEALEPWLRSHGYLS